MTSSSPPPPTITIPPTTPHTHTIIFLHGRGDTARNFFNSLKHLIDSQRRSLGEIYPSFKWVFPSAEPLDSAAFPGRPKVSQWFDIWDVQNFSEREELQAVGLKASVARVRAILAEEAQALGGRWERVVLAGISQGAATGVHVLLNLQIPVEKCVGPRRLGAFLGFSCRMPFPGRTVTETRAVLGLQGGLDGSDDKEVLRNTPVLLEHCVDDPLVLVEWGRGLRDTLRGFGMQVTCKEYPSGGHWFNCPTGTDDMVEFLSPHLQSSFSSSKSSPEMVNSALGAMDMS